MSNPISRRLPADQAARSGVLSQWDLPMAVDASAGTGKTRLLLDRLMALLLDRHVRLSRIAAMTFTEKAAGELSSRLRRRLEQEWKEQPDRRRDLERALEDLESCPIGTIHSFCTGLLREHALSAGIDPRFTLLDAPSSDALADETWEAWLRGLKETPALSRALTLGVKPNSFHEFKNQLLRFRALLQKPQANPLPPEMEADALLKQGLDLFKAWSPRCKDESDSLWKAIQNAWGDWERSARLSGVDKILSTASLGEIKIGVKTGNKKNWGDAPLAEAREVFQGLGVGLEAFREKAQDSVLTGLLEALWGWTEQHQKEKRRRGLLDFDDLLIFTRDLLAKDASARESLRLRHDILMLDEFQDTDPLQAEIVFRLCETKGTFASDWRKASLRGGKLMVVGDPKQSIYRFRRADVEVYTEVLKAIQESSGREAFILSENFRSCPALMRWTHGVFGKLFQNRSEGWAEPSAYREENNGEGALSPVTALCLDVPEKANAEEKRRIAASAVAGYLKGLLGEKRRLVWDRPTGEMRPLRAGDIAILFKDLSNNEEPYEEAFRALGVPYQVVGGKRFYRRSEIVALANLLTALDSPADEASVVAVLRGPALGFTDGDLVAHQEAGGHFRYLEEQSASKPTAVLPAFDLLRFLHKKTARRPVAESIRSLLTETPLLSVTLAEPYGEQRAANLWKVADQASTLESSEALTFRSFAQWLRKRRDEETMEGEAPGPESTGDRVLLMTVHQAKGLEFPLVVVPNADVTPKPISFLPHRVNGTVEVQKNDLKTKGFEAAHDDENAVLRAETLRLLYVATTRAQDALVFPWYPSMDEKDFLFPVVEGWQWSKEDTMRVHTLPCGTEIQVVVPPDISEGRDPSAYRMAYDPSEIEGPEAFEWAEKFKARDAARREETLRHLKTVKRRTAHEADFEAESLSTNEDSLRRGTSQNENAASSGIGFGRLVHRLLEWSGREETKVDRAAQWASSLGLPLSRAQEAFQAVESLDSSDLGKRIRSAREVFRELPVTVNKNGETRDGRIDLAFLEDGQWVLVDYKTDHDPEKRLELYEAQVRFYADILQEATGRKVKEAVLVYLRRKGQPCVVKKVSLI